MENNYSRLQNLIEKGNSYFSNKDYKKAIDCFNKVLLIDSKDTDALNNKGAAYSNLKEY